jgi:hypothetical protein
MQCLKIVFGVTLGMAWVAGCGDGASSTGFDEGGASGATGSGRSSSGTSGGGSSGSTNGGSPSTTYADSGIACGMAGGCAPSQTCCYPAATMPAMGPPMGGPPAGPSCVAQGSCQGSSLSCSSTQHCSSGSVCCFAYGGSDGGAGPGGFGGAGGFSAQCASQCPMGQYQLCADSSECTSGGTCMQGPYAKYCAMGFDGGFNFMRGDGGFRVRDAAASD